MQDQMPSSPVSSSLPPSPPPLPSKGANSAKIGTLAAKKSFLCKTLHSVHRRLMIYLGRKTVVAAEGGLFPFH